MENSLLLFNNSNVTVNGTFPLPEFSYWRPTLSFLVIFSTIILGGVAIVPNLPVLVALLKTKKLRTPLNIIHVSVLIEQNITRIYAFLLVVAYAPSILRNCTCSVVLSNILSPIIVTLSAYEPLAFACLAVMQLLHIKNARRITIKSALIGVCLSVAYSVAFGIEMIILLGRNNFTDVLVCPGRCFPATDDSLSPLQLLTVTYVIGAWIPCLIIVFVTSTWSCLTLNFKKCSIGRDEQLNRKMLSLPLIMPIVVILSNTLTGTVVGRLNGSLILSLPLGVFHTYWLISSQVLVNIALVALNGLFSPLLLLYLMPPLRHALKKQPNVVAPTTTTGVG